MAAPVRTGPRPPAPGSVIFRCGITGRHRKATCRNGSASGQPARAASRSACSAARTVSNGSSAHQPSDRQASSASTPPALHRDEPAAESRSDVHRDRHVRIVRADHADVVAVMPDRGRDRAARQAEAVHEAAPDIAVDAVPLDDADLKEIVTPDRARARRRAPAGTPSSRAGDDLARNDADGRGRRPGRRRAEISAVTGAP